MQLKLHVHIYSTVASHSHKSLNRKRIIGTSYMSGYYIPINKTNKRFYHRAAVISSAQFKLHNAPLLRGQFIHMMCTYK